MPLPWYPCQSANHWLSHILVSYVILFHSHPCATISPRPSIWKLADTVSDFLFLYYIYSPFFFCFFSVFQASPWFHMPQMLAMYPQLCTNDLPKHIMGERRVSVVSFHSLNCLVWPLGWTQSCRWNDADQIGGPAGWHGPSSSCCSTL